MFSIRNVRPVCLLLIAGCSPSHETAGFVYHLGVDTTAVSSVTWAGNRAFGVYINRVPETTVTRWEATLKPDGSVERLERSQSRGDSIVERVVVSITGDSATIERTQGDSVTTRRLAATSGAIPRHVSSDPALFELRSREMASGAEEVLTMFQANDTSVSVDTLRRIAADTMTIGQTRFRVDSAGRILTIGAAERTEVGDIEALAASLRDRPLGQLSPRDSITAQVGNAAVTIAYGRPRKRGREILGGLVPFNQVWRTGAGDASFLTTDRALQIGNRRVPAGRYGVFTIPSDSGWTLILSSNIGENAAVYDSSADFARIPMQSGSTPEPVDQFTIAVEAEGVLRLSWDRATASVPVRAR